jgi:hypothetical protein
VTAPVGSPSSAGRARPRVATLLLGLVTACLLPQLPASAHPGGVELPPNYESRVTAVEGDAQGIRARIAGADELVVLEVPEGVEVEVPGYNPPERYLRFDAEGDVHANTSGPTHHYNTVAGLDLRRRPELRADAAPMWEPVASGGRYAWADQRIRWMGPDPTPPQLDTDRAQRIRGWEIPILVEGEPVLITGELHWVPTPSPALPLAIALVVAAALIVRRSGRLAAVAVALGAVATATVAVAGTEVVNADAGSQAASLPAVVVALVLAVRGTARSDAPKARAQALGLGALGLAVAIAFHLEVITTAVLPGALPSEVARPLIGAAAGAAIAGAVTSVLVLRRVPTADGSDDAHRLLGAHRQLAPAMDDAAEPRTAPRPPRRPRVREGARDRGRPRTGL